ncbi:MAG TPA: hypothetical protein VFV87_08550, partial [Pirellulaceae bacterium]|nr:hypothetical protein [Pirellulaceae bacterium]
MRLTLRTMLAYLDDVLDPADAEVLGKKIEESEFASTLVKRIREIGKKVRMDAPKLDGKGMGNDANTVAEYLDSTLPQDRVGDLERICLESDRHLSEVAACHQILTLVLGKPADVPEGVREKIYLLGQPDHAPATTKKVKSPPIPTTNGKPHAHPAPEVPDYLRSGQRSSVLPFLAAVAAAFLIGAVVLRAMGPFNGSHPVMRWFGADTSVAEASKNAETPGELAPEPQESPKNATSSTPSPKDPVESTGDTEPPAPAPSDTDTPVPPEPVEPPMAPRPEVTLPEVPEEAPKPETTPKPETAPEVETTPKPPVPMPPPLAKPADPAIAMDVGRYVSDEQIMAALNPEDGLWYIKPTRAVLAAGERLLVLPTYRPQIALPSGVQLTFASESAIQMEEPSESGTSRLTVDYGKFVAVTFGAAGAQIELNLAGIEGTVTLVDADSSLAVKVARWHPPGTNPEVGPGMPVLELFTSHGRVTWQQTDQKKVDIPANHVHIYVGAEPPETHGPFYAPEWIDPRSTSGIDRETSLVL